MERRKEEDSSLYEGCKLFLSEDGFEVVRVDCGIASILPFRIDVSLFSKSIWFGAKMTKTEPNDKVELKRYSDHCTYLWINTLIIEKYSRFL